MPDTNAGAMVPNGRERGSHAQSQWRGGGAGLAVGITCLVFGLLGLATFTWLFSPSGMHFYRAQYHRQTGQVLEPVGDPDGVWLYGEETTRVLEHYYMPREEVERDYIAKQIVEINYVSKEDYDALVEQHRAQLESIRLEIEQKKKDDESLGFLGMLLSML